MSAAVAKAALRDNMHDLLRWAPADKALNDAAQRLMQRDMDPPQALELPDNLTPQLAFERFERWSAEDLTASAQALLSLPNPDDWRACGVALELLLAAGDERTASLLAQMESKASNATSTEAADDENADARRSQCGLWRFRFELGRLDTSGHDGPAAALESLVGAARATCEASDFAEALRYASAFVISELNAPGAHWLVPCAGGRRIANLTLALLRRPSLADAMQDALAWLEEAEDLAPGRGAGGVAGLISASDDADRRGRYDEGTERLRKAVARSAEGPQLVAAIRARAEILMRHELAAGFVEGSEDDEAGAQELAFPDISTLVQVPAAPAQGWASHLTRLADEEHPVSAADAALLEAAGSLARAARAHLQSGTQEGLLQAWRLREHLDDASHKVLVDRLEPLISDDEVELANSSDTWVLTYAWLTLSAVEPFWWGIRLRASLPEVAHALPIPVAVNDHESDDDATEAADPHSTTNRLAAAADLASAGRLDAASTVVSALFKHVETDAQRGQLIAISRSILKDETPPPAFVGAVERLISAPGEEPQRQLTASAMTQALMDSATMAYPLHASLYRAAVEAENLSDPERVALLQAWLGIWRATATPPAVEAVRKLSRKHSLILALAAFRIADDADPVASAIDFCERYPARTTSAGALADALLTAASS